VTFVEPPAGGPGRLGCRCHLLPPVIPGSRQAWTQVSCYLLPTTITPATRGGIAQMW
jgi:hypothetical protein